MAGREQSANQEGCPTGLNQREWQYPLNLSVRGLLFIACFLISVAWVSYGSYVRYNNYAFNWRQWERCVYKSWITDYEQVRGAKAYAIEQLGGIPADIDKPDDYYIVRPADLLFYFGPALLLLIIGLRCIIVRRYHAVEFWLFAIIAMLLLERILFYPYFMVKD
jgi:hypothetical protein